MRLAKRNVVGAEDEVETLMEHVVLSLMVSVFTVMPVRLVVHQEVIFGAQGGGLTCVMILMTVFPLWVGLIVKEVVKRDQLVYGLETFTMRLLPSEFQKALPILEKISCGF